MAAPDAFALLKLAGAGDLAAQLALANRAVQLACDPESGCDPYLTIVEGMVFARMAAAQGGMEANKVCLTLAGLLCHVAGSDLCVDHLAEAIARVELMADAGDEEAALTLSTLAENATPEIMATAQHFRARLSAHMEIQQ